MKNAIFRWLIKTLVVSTILLNLCCSKDGIIEEEQVLTSEQSSTLTSEQSSNLKAVVPEEGKTYYIMNVGSNKFLTRGNEFIEDGRSVMQWEYGTTEARQWKIIQDDDLSWHFQNVETGDYLTIADDIYDNGTDATLQDFARVQGEMWNVYFEVDFENVFTIRNRQSEKLLEVNNYQTGNGAFIQQWSDDDHDWQRWKFYEI